MKRVHGILIFAILVLAGLAIFQPVEVEGGMYNASQEVTYKEYWINHNEFTGGCNQDGTATHPRGTSFIEPKGGLSKCPKTLSFTLNDDFRSAEKVEIYIDLWRNYDSREARFRLNNSTITHIPTVGSDYSRDIWIEQLDPGELRVGLNTITFWGERPYQVQDVAFRVYYSDAKPLIPAPGSDVTPPTGRLLTVTDDTGEIDINAGGRLMVNQDKLTLKAEVADAKYVEFHAYYEGYDMDRDGQWHDWQNLGRNNWFPGGRGEKPNGGTINHIGTVAIANGVATIEWKLPHVINQPGVKFKIRVVDAAGNAREVAGGESGVFKLVRDVPVVYYTIPGFTDFGIHLDGTKPQSVTYYMDLPANLDLGQFDTAYFIGNYWRKPRVAINTSPQFGISETGSDDWTLGIRQFNKNYLVAGSNVITYYYTGGYGHFIEEPGPMVVLKRNASPIADINPPVVASRVPLPNATNVDPYEPVKITLSDTGSGVDYSTVVMTVNGQQVTPVRTGTPQNFEFSAQINPRLPFDTDILVTFYGCDLKGNCMPNADVYTFRTAPPDLTPPIISNVAVNATDLNATITWLTDESATSKVAYGLTTAYELGVVENANRVTQHSIPLTGLQADTYYHYQITSTDVENNTTVTTDLVFKTRKAPGAIASDQFNGCVLDTETWDFINPLNDATAAVDGEQLLINVPAGVGHDIWRTGVLAPRVMQYVLDTDFQVEAKFDHLMDKQAQLVGILVDDDSRNYLRFGFQFGQTGMTASVIDGNNGNPQITFSTPLEKVAPLYMRVSRTGSDFTFEYSYDRVNWTLVSTFTRAITMKSIGVYAGNSRTNPAHNAIVDYFLNLNRPISEKALRLDVGVIGNGAVTKNPDKATYQCNESVQLTAVPNVDWTFVGWSGDLQGSASPETVIMTETKAITATFTNDTPYTFSLNVVENGEGDGGDVTKNPDKPIYLFGDTINLTVTTNPGWTFTGWSGDLTGANLNETVVITGNTEVTATLTQDAYNLGVNAVSLGEGTGGTVTKSPDKPTYRYGDGVNLTATTNPGWTFLGWSGAVDSLEPTVALTMTQNEVISATFQQLRYPLNVTINSNGQGVGGAVAKDPDRLTYTFGEVVTVTATANPGWVFDGWTGAATGNQPTIQVTMDGEKQLQANFTQLQYTITTNVTGQGSITLTPQQSTYLYNDLVTITAVPQRGWELTSWSGDLTGSDNPVTVQVQKNYNITANFAIDPTPIEIISYSAEVLPGNRSARISWQTDVPSTGRVGYGLTDFYELGEVVDNRLGTNHQVVLTNLQPETRYHYRIIGVDEFDNSIDTNVDMGLDLTFTTSQAAGVISDDFSSCSTTVSNIWTFVNPLNDSPPPTQGNRQVQIAVAGGAEHNIWRNGAQVPHLRQTINNADLAIEVKFDSALTTPISSQGVFFEQDASNLVRFDFYSNKAGEITIFAATIADGRPRARASKIVAASTPMYLRVTREGDKWTQEYSFDGQNWTQNASFTFPLTLRAVGLFGGNSGNQPPQHTAVVDYFYNRDRPIVPEEGHYPLDITVQGSGQVTKNPNKAAYGCGDSVQLSARPATGWKFVRWQGGAGVIANPTSAVTTLTFNRDMDYDIVAVFQEDGAPPVLKTYLPMVARRP